MPLVKRTVEQKTETTFGLIHADHVFFVPASKRRPTDVVVEPNDDQLADLAYRVPKEPSGVGKLTFAELAKQRGVEPYTPPVEAPAGRDEEQLTAMANMAVKMFPNLKTDDALALIDSTQELEVLKAFFQAEIDSEKPRDAIVKAFRAKGLKVVEVAEPELEDEGEPGQEGEDEGQGKEPPQTPRTARPSKAPKARKGK